MCVKGLPAWVRCISKWVRGSPVQDHPRGLAGVGEWLSGVGEGLPALVKGVPVWVRGLPAFNSR